MKKILLLCLALAMAIPSALIAAGTQAGVSIRLQSTATYTDAIGQSQSVSSNEVIIIVAEKAGFSASAKPDTLSVASGNAADYSYIITNTGNVADSFTLTYTATGSDADSVTAYFDANMNGQVDAGDTAIASGSATPSINADESAGIIMQIVTDSNAVASTSNIDVDLTIASVANNSLTAARDDMTVTLTSGEGVLSYTATVNGETAGVSTAMTFALSGSNTGEAGVYGEAAASFPGIVSDGVLVEYDLTNAVGSFNLDGAGGATDYSGITINSRAPASGVIYYWDSTNSQWDLLDTVLPGTTAGTAKIALFLDGSGEVLSVGQQFELEFSVSTLASVTDAYVTFDGTATYDATNADSGSTVKTNPVTIFVTESVTTTTFATEIAPYTSATTGTITNGSTRASLQHPAVLVSPTTSTTLTVGTDTVSAGDRSAGEEIFVPLTVSNSILGALTDTYAITASSSDAAIVVELLQADGVTPLQDSNGDNVRDTGLVALGSYKDIVARLIIDEAADISSTTTITVTATSSNGSTTDNTTITIDQVLPSAVDIAADTFAGDADNTNDDPTAITVAAGTSGSVALEIENVREDDSVQLETGDFDAYKLTSTISGGGLSVQFYESTNASEEILNTTSMSPFPAIASNRFGLNAVVNVPAGAAPGSYTVTVTATSTNNAAQANSITFTVTVPQSSSLDIEPEVFATVVAGGNVVISHTILNTGNVALTNVTVSVPALPAGYTAYWTSTAGINVGTGTSNNTAGSYMASASLAASAEVTVYLRITVPTSEPAGSTLSLEVTATSGGATDSVIDILQVIAGNLALAKEQRTSAGSYADTTLTTIAPGDSIFYRTTFENKGSSDLIDVKIYEPIPEHTDLANATLSVTDPTGAGTVEFSTDGGITWGPAPGTLSTVTNIRVSLSGNLEPGESGTVEFEVTVE